MSYTLTGFFAIKTSSPIALLCSIRHHYGAHLVVSLWTCHSQVTVSPFPMA